MEVKRWLLEEENPSARYLTLRHILGEPEDDPRVTAARAAIPDYPPARAILEAQWPAGYWMHPDVGYSPRHKATVWQVIFLSALGAPLNGPIERASAYVLEHSRLPDGRFTARGTDRTAAILPMAGGTFLCLNGSLVRALLRLGHAGPRLAESVEALAGMLLGGGPRCEGCDRQAAGSSMGPEQATAPPCIYGTVKALGAFAEVQEGQRSQRVRAAVSAGITLLTGQGSSGEDGPRLLAGTYRAGTAAGAQAHRFGFPPDHRADLLEALEVLARLGAGPSPIAEAALDAVHRKQDAVGRWPLEYTPENMWASFGDIGQPNKWVTIRALQVLALWSAS